MTTGPKPTPTNLKILRGNPGRRPLNEREANVSLLTALPRPPSHLGPIGARKWRSKGRQLIAAGLLTELDLEPFGRWCKWHEVAVIAAEQLTGEVTGWTVLSTFSMASKALHQLESEFGMTPAARSRVKVANPDKKLNPFEEFRRRGKNQTPGI